MVANLTNRDPNLHLRDARHAHNLYTSHGMAFAPKTKFLYHTIFEVNQPAKNRSPNTINFIKEIGVLAKTVDLPQYQASVETKNQYNRKKHVQTRIDYNEVRIAFHDDNEGVTRGMLEDYYTYYYRDGNKVDNGSLINYGSRDKYSPIVGRYGLDNDTDYPFFNYIRIYQLSRQKWFSYTLINPLITQWGHDTLDNSDGTGLMENVVSIAYEGVIYNNGAVSERGEPAGFTDQETRYDTTPSPLIGSESSDLSPSIFNRFIPTELPAIFERNNISSAGDPNNLVQRLLNQQGTTSRSLNQLEIPKTNIQQPVPRAATLSVNSRGINNDRIISVLSEDPSVLESVVKKSLATGSYSSEYSSLNFTDFDNLSQEEKTAIEQDILNKISSNDPKLQQIASIIINSNNGV